jgi:hypothetical protein
MMSLVFAQLTHMAPRYVRESAWETAVEIGGIRWLLGRATGTNV